MPISSSARDKELARLCSSILPANTPRPRWKLQRAPGSNGWSSAREKLGEEVDAVRSSGLSYVFLITGRRARSAAAAAIDWADDLAGDIQLEVDLRRETIG